MVYLTGLAVLASDGLAIATNAAAFSDAAALAVVLLMFAKFTANFSGRGKGRDAMASLYWAVLLYFSYKAVYFYMNIYNVKPYPVHMLLSANLLLLLAGFAAYSATKKAFVAIRGAAHA